MRMASLCRAASATGELHGRSCALSAHMASASKGRLPDRAVTSSRRGVEGKIAAAKYARENNKPYLGICLGMQVAVIEFARNVLGLEDANSTEINPATPHPVVVFMPEGSTTHMGGTMRLGARRTYFTTVDCIAARLYRTEVRTVQRCPLLCLLVVSQDQVLPHLRCHDRKQCLSLLRLALPITFSTDSLPLLSLPPLPDAHPQSLLPGRPPPFSEGLGPPHA